MDSPCVSAISSHMFRTPAFSSLKKDVFHLKKYVSILFFSLAINTTWIIRLRSCVVIPMDNNRLMNDFVIDCKGDCVYSDRNGR